MPERPPTETQEEIDPNDVEEVIEENVAVPGETPNQKPYLVENNRVRKGKNVLVGRFEIAYNQFWIDRHQKQTVEIKNKIDGVDIKIGALDRSIKEIASVINDLKRQGVPGGESLKLKLKEIERKMVVLKNEKDKLQTKFDVKENKMKLNTNQRDAVANKLIRHYDEKLEPMEGELESLATTLDETDLLVAVTEARHNGLLERLSEIEEKKTQVEEALKKIGMSAREISKFEAVTALHDILVSGRATIKNEKEDLKQRKAVIQKEIAAVDAKAGPYRDKKEAFVRIKSGRPIEMKLAERTKENEFTGQEDIKAHPRASRAEAAPASEKSSPETAPVKEGDKGRYSVSAFVGGWNKHLEKDYGAAATGEMIDLDDFIGATKLPEDFKMNSKDFKNIAGKYSKLRNKPTDKLNKTEKSDGVVDKFFDGIINSFLNIK
ncbi:MAG: hypothetical protein A3I29_00570 [Candidatus Magasanikbacteria bacterium RIFCSPLOWO2_02_FULL_44_11]|uniref:Uncharacterized protein n=1 Tax=Candidatus Magasanikbacteria bacterium RIFCSPLOWO2_02_FULL_44_11 TaxID=1798689 RepID=A0A1F6N962_9BACT|nr:MAG: hypothetical protein A3I29_00570 [Candidatus Magasanikbacteria bacterium RIFCSPLOWO2_02_FULL_44_11]